MMYIANSAKSLRRRSSSKQISARLRLHFGLGDSKTYDAVEVRWPTGERQRFPGGAANRSVALKQGAGQ